MDKTKIEVSHEAIFYSNLADGKTMKTTILLMVTPKGFFVGMNQQQTDLEHTASMVFMPDQLDLIIESLINISNTIDNVY
jgi:hypothetical protein